MKEKLSNILSVVLGVFFFLLFLLWILSNIMQFKWQWGLSEYSIVIIMLLSTALFLRSSIKGFSLPGGIAFEFRDLTDKVKEIHDVQLLGEVIFNIERPNELFWIDKNKSRRRLPNKDVALLFMTQKGIIGVTKNILDGFNEGTEISAIKAENFVHNEGHLFLILDGMLFYLSSWSLPIKYGQTNIEQMNQITLEDFRNNQIIR
ncbi:MAG: hypothetical protein P4L45_07670 [Ignavibacteriaceae bacterium]|nr:hypothetical protein [Ignavibacteriaceae bacterium]